MRMALIIEAEVFGPDALYVLSSILVLKVYD